MLLSKGSNTAAQLNISALARRTGVAADTLRKWEQRYGIINPSRTAGGQRRYTELDVARVEWLRDRLREGYRIGEAAQLLGETPLPAGRDPASSREQIVEAAEEGDQRRLGQLLDQAFALHGVETTLTAIVAPLLEELGRAWEEGRVSVAEEHLASETIRARLVQLLADTRGSVRGIAVLACAPGERHDLGLLMLAILLRADGWQVAYLGADTPFHDAVAFAERLNAQLMCVSVAMSDRTGALGAAMEEQRLPRDLAIVLGGRGATPTLARRLGATHVNGDLGRSVNILRRFAV